MTITITVEREHRGQVTDAEEQEMVAAAGAAVRDVIHGGGDCQIRRITMGIWDGGKK